MPPSGFPECFLCGNDLPARYFYSPAVSAYAGYGPIREGYSVVGTTQHHRSLADTPSESLLQFWEFLDHLRERLEAMYGPCLVTEHGRTPACHYRRGMSEAHCYHAHVLVFPNAPTLTDEVANDFVTYVVETSLPAAMQRARMLDQYFLFSRHRSEYFVLSGQYIPVRQYARRLVATAIGKPELADWRTRPAVDEVASTADRLRALFDGAGRFAFQTVFEKAS